jgi:hypothetical protein
MDEELIPGGFSQGFNVRGHIWMKPQQNTEKLTITLEEIFSKLSGKADFKIEEKLKKSLALDAKGKEMLNLLDDGKLTEAALRKAAIDANVPLGKLLTEIIIQRRTVNQKFYPKAKKVPKGKDNTAITNKIGIDELLAYQKSKSADTAKEKQEKMSNSVKTLSGLFSSFELSYDAIREEAKKSQFSPAELAVQFIQSNPELRVEYEKRLGSIPATKHNEKEIEELAMVIILEDENNKIKEKIKENSREISVAKNDSEKQKLENEGENLEDKLGDIGQDLLPLKISQNIF